MSCSAPIDIPTNGNVNPISGAFNCVYDPNALSNAAVSLASDRSHLTITCTSNNSKVSFYNAGTYAPHEIRIYKPSLHTYNGGRADAELLIVHSTLSSNSKFGSDGLIVSVPITMGGNKKSGLNSIIRSANTLNSSAVSFNSSVPISTTVDMNEFIPSKPFYVYNGTLPYESCGGNYYYAVFTDPISIATTINNLTPSGIKMAPPPALLQKSKTGPTNGMGSNSNDEYVLFEVVDTCDSDQTNNSYGSLSSKSNASDNTSFIGLNVLWGLLITCVLGLIYWIFTKSKNGGNGGGGSMGDAVITAATVAATTAATAVNNAATAVTNAASTTTADV